MTSFAELRASSTMVWATFPTNAFSSFSPLPRLLKLGTSAPRAPPHSRVAAHTTIRPLNTLLMRETPCGVNWDRPIHRGETFPRGRDDEQGEETWPASAETQDCCHHAGGVWDASGIAGA